MQLCALLLLIWFFGKKKKKNAMREINWQTQLQITFNCAKLNNWPFSLFCFRPKKEQNGSRTKKKQKKSQESKKKNKGKRLLFLVNSSKPWLLFFFFLFFFVHFKPICCCYCFAWKSIWFQFWNCATRPLHFTHRTTNSSFSLLFFEIICLTLKLKKFYNLIRK